MQGFGNLLDGNGDYVEDAVFFGETATIAVDFAGSAITETDLVLLIDDPAFYKNLSFSGDGGAIAGNGFADTMSLSCPDGVVCDGTVLIGGAFFGPNGEELAGNIAVDYSINAINPLDSDRFIGAGYFVATDSSIP